ncbi:hypothetical protein [Planktotalea sp.]|uniref:hypothetical protein n=1 Tax=Planktotalea sp. TaxID=2029877 RepID=UPI003F6CCCDA
MNTTQRCKANKTPTMPPNGRRLCVTLSELTLAKRPAEFARITELHAAIKALAREAARADHTTKP